MAARLGNYVEGYSKRCNYRNELAGNSDRPHDTNGSVMLDISIACLLQPN